MVMKDAELTTYLFLFSHLEKLRTKSKIKSETWFGYQTFI